MINILISILTGIYFHFNYSGSQEIQTTPLQEIKSGITTWITKADRTELLNKQSGIIPFTNSVNRHPVIIVDTSQCYQTIDGFGFTLTGGSAFLINKLMEAEKILLLNELFGRGENSIGISYLRISIGASDLSQSVFSYDDLPAGETDPDLKKFSLSEDTTDLIPLLKKILKINPGLKIMGSPWSAP